MNKTRIQKTVIYFYIYLIMLIVLLFMTNSGIRPFKFLVKIPNYDKIGHILIYGIASFLSVNAFSHFTISRFKISYGPLLITAIALIDECIQYYIPSRKGTLPDFACSLTGIVIFYCIRLFWENKKNK